MTLAPHANVADVRSKIEAALTRSAEVDARRINIVIADGKVILSGNVHSVSERARPAVPPGLRLA